MAGPTPIDFTNPNWQSTITPASIKAESEKWRKETEARNAAVFGPRAGSDQLTAFSARVSTRALQTETTAGNVQAAASSGSQAISLATKAAAGLNPVAATEFYKALGTALPGYRSVVDKMQANTMSALAGELPPDVVNMIKMTSGERQQQGALASTARNLGLTSLQRSDVGFKMGADLLGLAKNYLTAPTYDVFSGYERAFAPIFGESAMTPAQAGQISLAASAQQQQRQEFDANLAWTKELSAMNQVFEREKMAVEANMSEQAMRQAAASKQIESNAYQNLMGRLVAPGASDIAAEIQKQLKANPGWTTQQAAQQATQIAATHFGKGEEAATSLLGQTQIGKPVNLESVDITNVSPEEMDLYESFKPGYSETE